MNPYTFLRYLFLPAIVIIGIILGGWWNFTLPVLCFVIHPLYNLAFRKTFHHHEDHDNDEHTPVQYRVVALSFVPVLLGMTVFGIYSSVTASAIEFTGMIISIGSV